MALNNFLKVNLPYHVTVRESGEIVAVNREYLPLGVGKKDEDIPEGFPTSIKYSRATEKILKAAAYDGQVRDGSIFLYNDGCTPTSSKKDMDAYLQRLAVLSKLKVKDFYQ